MVAAAADQNPAGGHPSHGGQRSAAPASGAASMRGTAWHRLGTLHRDAIFRPGRQPAKCALWTRGFSIFLPRFRGFCSRVPGNFL